MGDLGGAEGGVGAKEEEAQGDVWMERRDRVE